MNPQDDDDQVFDLPLQYPTVEGKWIRRVEYDRLLAAEAVARKLATVVDRIMNGNALGTRREYRALQVLARDVGLLPETVRLTKLPEKQ